MLLRTDRLFSDKGREYIGLYQNFCDGRQSWNSFSLFFGAVLLKFCEESKVSSNPFSKNTEHPFSGLVTEKNAYENLISLLDKFLQNNSIEFTDITNQDFFENNLSKEGKDRKVKILALELSDKNKSLTDEKGLFFITLFRYFQHGNYFFNPEQRAQENAKKLMFALAEKKGCENIVFSGIENGVYFDYQENYTRNIFVGTESMYSFLIQTILKKFSESENIKILKPKDALTSGEKFLKFHFPKSYVSMRRIFFRNEREPGDIRRADNLYKEYLSKELNLLFTEGKGIYLYVDARTLAEDYLRNEFFVLISQKPLDFAVRLPNMYFLGNYRQSFVFGFSNNKTKKGVLLVDASIFTENKTRNSLTTEIVESIADIITNRKEKKYYAKIFTEIEDFKLNLFKPLHPESAGSENFSDKLKNLKDEINSLTENIGKLEDEFDELTDDIKGRIPEG
ncbi:hypothetical protein JXA84_09020 [candidate division WOR-3 bacterium]|nr:hypothetical protein [candidate division WOR-3 bacterium]